MIAEWDNVHKEQQTSYHLEECLLRHETILKAQGNTEENLDKDFFARASFSKSNSRHKSSRAEQHCKDVEYLKDLGGWGG